MLGDAVEITDGYRMWWSYVPHFIGTPGYVYAYAYGQLLALSVYRRYLDEGEAFVPRYLEMLAAGGSMLPEDLGAIVGIDLTDPGFWVGRPRPGRGPAARRRAGRAGRRPGLGVPTATRARQGALVAAVAGRRAPVGLPSRLLVAGRERLAGDTPVGIAHDPRHDDREVAARHGLAPR